MVRWRQVSQACVSKLDPLYLLTPFPGSQWIVHPLLYHPAYLIPLEDGWLWLKKLNNGKTKVWHRINLTAPQNFFSFPYFWDEVWVSLPSTRIRWNSFNHCCLLFRDLKGGSFVFQSFLFSRDRATWSPPGTECEAPGCCRGSVARQYLVLVPGLSLHHAVFSLQSGNSSCLASTLMVVEKIQKHKVYRSNLKTLK